MLFRSGWYVMPLLDGDRLVGRIEAKLKDDVLQVSNVWEEQHGSVAPRRLDELLTHHAWACGAKQMVRPLTFRRSS